ncbi:MAG: N-acetylglucosamine-6-phosphate deacetylase, partial [Candidatus Acidiferrales bacterium]
MPPLAIFPDTLLSPLEAIANAVVIVENERILAAGPRDAITVPKSARELRAPGKILVPGFVDVHVHGAGGSDVMDAHPEALRTIATVLARFGATSFVPTTVTASADRT